MTIGTNEREQEAEAAIVDRVNVTIDEQADSVKMTIGTNYKRTDSANKAIGTERTKIDLRKVRRSERYELQECHGGHVN
jgi:tRNA 2-selenouridine synthase SelU